MTKILVFDMDGTIANLYGVYNWLEMLQTENVLPYVIAKPMYDMNELNFVLNELKKVGWKIVVTSWLAMNGSETYNFQTRKAKKEWLEKYNFPYDEIHLVKYGTTKANCTRHYKGFQILIDDNEKIRRGWTLGDTINANENILEELKKLLTN